MKREREWFSAQELAGLPGLPSDRNNVRNLAERQGWQKRARVGKGGGGEYHITSLPSETQCALDMSQDMPSIDKLPDLMNAIAQIRDPEALLLLSSQINIQLRVLFR